MVMIGGAVIKDIVRVTTYAAKETHKHIEAAVTDVISPLFNSGTVTVHVMIITSRARTHLRSVVTIATK